MGARGRPKGIGYEAEGTARGRGRWREGTWDIEALTVSRWGSAEGLCPPAHMRSSGRSWGGFGLKGRRFTTCPGGNLVQTGSMTDSPMSPPGRALTCRFHSLL